ncbi:MAG: L-aspartate oxidase [Lachnospiraceae bacterium]|nr:L-aspartate oxidase [Lachnospiraceae bacterium]
MDRICDVVIVGTGAAGLFCALNFPAQVNIRMITKQKAEESDSFLAQGGICMLRGEEDYPDYFEDTMRAGHYENDKKAVDLMIRSSNSMIRELIRYGVRFEYEGDNGQLAFTKEGAHSQPRILFHEDVTGREITSTLLARVRERPNVVIDEYTTMVDILSDGNVCGGIVAVGPSGERFCIKAPNVVLACGGIGGLYKNSTNFPHMTGDALAIALKHGVEVSHLDYIQIHPTTLFSEKPGRRFLISESVRGEGALLYNKDGKRFTDELQPRDLLSEAIWKQMEADGTDYVWEDMRPIGKETILQHFPNIYEHCLEEGFDVLKEPIPVVPAQHYHMGGIAVNLASETSMDGLYAVGEASCNGVHGKNRLASNSLLESLVFAQRAADDILFGSRHQGCDAGTVHMEEYEDMEQLFGKYRSMIFSEIEREKNCAQ